MKTLQRSAAVVLCLMLGAALFGSCGGDEPATSADLEFSDVWSRQPASGQPNSAIYGTIKNSGSTDVTITGATMDVTDRVELHEVVDIDGLMTMREREDGFVVPANGELTLEPGGLHVMVMGIDADTYPTDAVDVTFEFDSGDPAFVTAVVKAIDPDAMSHDMDMDDSDHDN